MSRIVRKYYLLTKIIPKKPYCFAYSSISNLEKKLRVKNVVNFKQYLSLCTGWHNTARHDTRGQVVTDITPEKFYKTVDVQYKRSAEMENEFLFINAWNEWAEGMYLEPAERWGTAYLEAIK